MLVCLQGIETARWAVVAHLRLYSLRCSALLTRCFQVTHVAVQVRWR